MVTMIAPPTYLRNWQLVVGAFGYWPSFHDANLSGFRSSSEAAGAIEFVLHGFEMTAEVDERGYFRLRKHHLVSFRFEGHIRPRARAVRPGEQTLRVGLLARSGRLPCRARLSAGMRLRWKLPCSVRRSRCRDALRRPRACLTGRAKARAGARRPYVVMDF